MNKLICELPDLEKRSTKLFRFLGIVITIMGIGAFPCFIMEESMQTAMFAAFAYNNARDWDGLEYQINVMKKTQHTAEVVVYSIGWLNPFTFPAYINYLKNNKAYIRSQESVIAHH